MADQARSLALIVLVAAARAPGRTIDHFLETELAQTHLHEADRRWVTEAVLGVTRWRLRLDLELATAFRGRLKKAQHALLAALRLGLYQLRFMDTPSHAAVHATVESAKRLVPAGAVRMLNGVLRTLERRGSKAFEQSLPTDTVSRLSALGSHPEWLVKRWIDRYGPESTEALLAFNNSPPRNWIHLNPGKASATELEQLAADLKVTIEEAPQIANAYSVQSLDPLINTELFRNGGFWIQDLAATMVPTLLPMAANQRILDLCAAPGGKTIRLATLAPPDVEIIASDNNPVRLKRIRNNLERLQFAQCRIEQLDILEDELPSADAILLDVPCSGTGVLHRRADSRWRKQVSDIETLARLQEQMLDNSWQVLNPGGTLVYSTCTLEPEENWDLVRRALARHADMQVNPVENSDWEDYVDSDGAFRTRPWIDGLDGMFAVRLRKT